MILRKAEDYINTPRDIEVCRGNARSARILVRSDGFPFSVNHTRINGGTASEICYEKHFESCYCIEGIGFIRDSASNQTFNLCPGTLYALKPGTRHILLAESDLVLLSIFTPPLRGDENHNEEGSYE